MDLLTIFQIIVALSLIILVLIQERSAGFSQILGGMEGASYQARRGLEKFIFRLTWFLVFLFIVLALINLIV